MKNWFIIVRVDPATYIISEYRHWEETHCYLLIGSEHSLLIDTGLGICNIHEEVVKLTEKPVTAVATHIHWDHIGGHQYFPDFYAHERELITITSLLTAGGCEPQLEVHINGSLNVGIPPRKIVETFLQCIPYTGFPRVLNAIFVAKKIFAEHVISI